MAVENWNTNPDLNTTLEGENTAEGMFPEKFNDVIRKMASAIRVFFNNTYGSGTSGGGKKITIQAAGGAAPASPSENDIWIEYTP